MIEKMSTYILDNILYKGETIEGDQRDIMLFGITRIIEDIPKYLAIILISSSLKILSEVAIVFLIVVCYKGFVGGVHARTNWECFFSTLTFFLLPVYMSKFINISRVGLIFVGILIYILSVYVIVKIAPADTEEVPILKKKRRTKNKLLSLFSLNIIYISLIMMVKNTNISEIVLYTILLIDVLTTKWMYKLFRCKYSYESEEFKEFYNS